MGLFKKSHHGAGKSDAGAAPVVVTRGGAASFDVIKFKVSLKSGVNRAQLQKNKHQNAVAAAERDIAEMLRNGKEGLARVRMESTLRDMIQDEAMDMLVVFAEMLHSRAGVLDQGARSAPPGTTMQLGALPQDTLESLASVAYAAPRLDNPELRKAVDEAKVLFGAHALDELARGEGSSMRFINHRMRAKLDTSIPEGRVVLEHLKRVAAAHGVNWQPPAEFEDLQNASAAHIPTHSYVQHAPPGAAFQQPSMPPPSHHYSVPGYSAAPQYEPGMYQPGHHPSPGELYPTGGVYVDSRVRNNAPEPHHQQNYQHSQPQAPLGYGAPAADGYGAVDGFGGDGGGMYASAPPPPDESGFGHSHVPYAPSGPYAGPPPSGPFAASPQPVDPPPSGPFAANSGGDFDDDLMARINNLRK